MAETATKKRTRRARPKSKSAKQAASAASVTEVDPVESPATKPYGVDMPDKPEQYVKKTERYVEAVGRRKTAIARVRLYTRAGDFSINGKPYLEYFTTMAPQSIAEDALKKMKLWERFRISARISGGGIRSQAEALRHGLARCLIAFNPDFRKRLKKAGFLTRDPRMKERKKFGLKKARRAPQWKKR